MERRLKRVAGIPAYNEEATIAKVIIRARKHVDRVVVIDDGSTDDTALIAEALGALVVRHEQKRGYGAAIRSCFKVARDLKANVLVTLDADGQHDPDQMPRLVEPVNDGSADLVLGSRFLKTSDARQAPRYRKAGIRLLTRLTKGASRAQFSDAQSGFRAYSQRVFEQILPTEEGMGVSVEILMKATEHSFRILEVPVTVRYRGLKTSTQNPFYHALEVAAYVVDELIRIVLAKSVAIEASKGPVPPGHQGGSCERFQVPLEDALDTRVRSIGREHAVDNV